MRRGSIWTRNITPGVGTGLAALALIGAVLATVWSAYLWHLPMAFVVMLWVIAIVIAAVGFAFNLVNGHEEVLQLGDPVASWQEAEQLAEAHMVAFGFGDAHVTRRGADGGLDVVARQAVAQVKYFSKPVGRPQVQGLRGAAHGVEHAWFYALTGYTAAAVEFAGSAGIALWQFDQFGRVWAVNAVAKRYRQPQPQPVES